MANPRINRWLWEGVRFTAYGLLFTLLLAGAVWLADYRITLYHPLGSTRETSEVDLSAGPPQSPLENDFPEDAEVRNVILLIADGMGPTHIVAARSELGGIRHRLGFERMPITGWLTTYDAGRVVSDSAATATAMATGVKTARGSLSIDVEGRPLRTVLEAARDRGMATGLVTDSYLWDATMAAFAAHAERREVAEVAAQMGRSGVSILFGERCSRCFDDEERALVTSGLESNGYAVATTWDEALATAAGGKLAGLFEPGTVAGPDRAPSLEQLASFSIERLSADPDGFFLVVETEETDTASHLHQFQRMVEGIGLFDQAAAVALEFARRDRTTLVLLTADHETGGLVVTSGRLGTKLGIRWTDRGHTALPVPLFAYGPGAEGFTGSRDNTEIAGLLASALKLERVGEYADDE